MPKSRAPVSRTPVLLRSADCGRGRFSCPPEASLPDGMAIRVGPDVDPQVLRIVLGVLEDEGAITGYFEDIGRSRGHLSSWLTNSGCAGRAR